MVNEGILKVLIVRWKNLRADDGDTSDPYCIIKFENFDDKVIEKKTNVKGKTINP